MKRHKNEVIYCNVIYKILLNHITCIAIDENICNRNEMKRNKMKQYFFFFYIFCFFNKNEVIYCNVI